MGMALPFIMAAGTGLSAMGQVAGGVSADRAAGINATIQDNQADQIDTQTAARVGQHQRDFRKFQGAQVSDMSAYGMSAKTGTGLLLAQEAARQAKLEEMNIVTEGTNAASAARMGAQMTRYEGKARKRQGIMGGLGTAISGGTDWYQSQYGG